MRRSSLMLGCAGALCVSGAMAADLGVPYYKAPPPDIYTWTGFYLGVNVGGGWANQGVTRVSPGTSFPAGTFSTHTESGAVGGVQAGYDFQFSRFVLGVVGSYDLSTISGATRDVSVVNGDIANSQDNVRNIADAGARVGYLITPDLLPYIKGGAAWERFEHSSFTTTPGLVLTNTTVGAETRNGWFVGGGIEWKPLRWLSLFAEYDHYDFGTATTGNVIVLANAATIAAGFPPGSTVLHSSSSRTDVVKVGLNWHPDWSIFGGPR